MAITWYYFSIYFLTLNLSWEKNTCYLFSLKSLFLLLRFFSLLYPWTGNTNIGNSTYLLIIIVVIFHLQYQPNGYVFPNHLQSPSSPFYFQREVKELPKREEGVLGTEVENVRSSRKRLGLSLESSGREASEMAIALAIVACSYHRQGRWGKCTVYSFSFDYLHFYFQLFVHLKFLHARNRFRMMDEKWERYIWGVWCMQGKAMSQMIL